jgi:hypothetical protein
MYGISTETQSESSLNVIGAGLQENCKLDKVAYEPSSEKNADSQKVLAFYFSQGSASFRHCEFPIDEARERDNIGKLYDMLLSKGQAPATNMTKVEFVNARLADSYSSQASRVKHIMTKFLSEQDAIIPPVPSFEMFANQVISRLKGKTEGVVLRLKIVLNNKDYSTFPKYPNFVEVQTDAPTSLKFTKYDRTIPKTPDNASASAGSYNDEI